MKISELGARDMGRVISVIAGWTLSYVFKTAIGTFGPGADTPAIFAEVAGNPVRALGWHFGFMLLTIYVVLGGVRDGIERWTKVLMPVLLVLLVLLAVLAAPLAFVAVRREGT